MIKLSSKQSVLRHRTVRLHPNTIHQLYRLHRISVRRLCDTGKKGYTMEITDLKIRKMMADGRLRAIVSITLDQMIAVHDIKVVQGETRLFVAMPSRKDEGGIFRDIVHPISAQARSYLETQILKAYEEQLALMQAESELDAAAGEAEAAEAVPTEPAQNDPVDL